MTKALRLLLPLLAVGALAAGCGGDDGGEVDAAGPSTTDPDTPVASPSSLDGGDDGTVTWARIDQTQDLVDPRVVAPDEIVPDPDDPSAVLVHFYGGVQECYGARASADESTDGQVVITLETGGQPDAGGQACIEIAEAQELVVTLAAPLGDRELVAAES